MEKPKVILIAAMSIDGFIAPLKKENEPSTVWTSKEDKQFFNQKSREIGTMIMGSRTFETIGRALPDRRSIVMTSRPEKYASYVDKNLIFTNSSPEEVLADLAGNGVKEVALCGGASIYALFLKKGLVDKLFLTVEPQIFGDGIKLFSEEAKHEFKLLSVKKLNEVGTMLLEYEAV